MKNIIIAIDGYSSCGKSTLAKQLATKLNYAYIDSGAMYRAVTLYCIENQIIENGDIDEEKLKRELLNIKISFKYNKKLQKSETFLNARNVETKIREMEVSNNVSLISKLAYVREQLVDLQQEMGGQKGIIMDGRDIGTVVFPNAEIKLFMTADSKVRAERRYKEFQEKNSNITLEEVVKNINERDYLDENRDVSPLKKADDAIVLDNTNINQEQQFENAMSLIIKKIEK